MISIKILYTGAGKGQINWGQKFLGQWQYSVWYYNDGHILLHLKIYIKLLMSTEIFETLPLKLSPRLGGFSLKSAQHSCLQAGHLNVIIRFETKCVTYVSAHSNSA